MIKKLLFILTLTFFIFKQGNAQNVQIVGSTYSPSAPLSCADLTYTLQYQTLCYGYVLDSTVNSISGTTITIEYYFTGPGPICAGVIGNHFDSYNIGMKPAGVYTVSYKTYIDLALAQTISAGSVTITSCCPVTASYTSSATVGCTDDTAPVVFTSTSTSATTNDWYVNDVLYFSGTSFSAPLPAIGSYDVKLVSSDGTCSDSLTQTYNVYTSPTIDLGPDTISCLGQTINLDAGAGFSSYEWTNNSSTSAIASVTTDNTYAVTVTDANGCTATDSLVATFLTPPTVFLGNDTTICSGDLLTLDPGVFNSYSWNTSETTQTINVINSFNYGVTVTDANGCMATDNISVLVNTLPNVSFGQDTFKACTGNSVMLNVGNYSAYNWSTTETTSSINVSAEGAVSVTVTDANNCSNTDDTYVKLWDLPMIDFGADTIDFCEGNSVTLNPGSFNSYSWSTMAISSTLQVSTGGDYSVSVTDANNCMNSESVNVKENANPVVDLGEDKDLCATEKITLMGGSFDAYLWNDGSSLATLEVNGADYSLGNNTFDIEVTDGNGCKGTDDIIINVKECNVAISSIALENSISISPNPAKNYLNIQIANNVSSNVKIYNVLGKVIMELNSQNLNSNSQIDISNLNQGIYFIELKIADERLVKQFLKN